MSSHSLETKDFARLLGHPEDQLPPGCLAEIARCDWRYDWIEGEQLDDVVTGLLERIRRKEFSIWAEGAGFTSLFRDHLARLVTAIRPISVMTSHAGPGNLCIWVITSSKALRNHSASSPLMTSGGSSLITSMWCPATWVMM